MDEGSTPLPPGEPMALGTGLAHPTLAEAIAREIGISLTGTRCARFPDGAVAPDGRWSEASMGTRNGSILPILAALLVLYTAMLNPWLSTGLALALLVAALWLTLNRSR